MYRRWLAVIIPTGLEQAVGRADRDSALARAITTAAQQPGPEGHARTWKPWSFQVEARAVNLDSELTEACGSESVCDRDSESLALVREPSPWRSLSLPAHWQGPRIVAPGKILRFNAQRVRVVPRPASGPDGTAARRGTAPATMSRRTASDSDSGCHQAVHDPKPGC